MTVGGDILKAYFRENERKTKDRKAKLLLAGDSGLTGEQLEEIQRRLRTDSVIARDKLGPR